MSRITISEILRYYFLLSILIGPCASSNKMCYSCSHNDMKLNVKSITRVAISDTSKQKVAEARILQPKSRVGQQFTQWNNETGVQINETRVDTVLQEIYLPACHSDKVKVVECVSEVKQCYYKRTMHPELERRFTSEVLQPKEVLPRRAFQVQRGCYSPRLVDLTVDNKKNKFDVTLTCRDDVCNSPDNDEDLNICFVCKGRACLLHGKKIEKCDSNYCMIYIHRNGFIDYGCASEMKSNMVTQHCKGFLCNSMIKVLYCNNCDEEKCFNKHGLWSQNNTKCVDANSICVILKYNTHERYRYEGKCIPQNNTETFCKSQSTDTECVTCDYNFCNSPLIFRKNFRTCFKCSGNACRYDLNSRNFIGWEEEMCSFYDKHDQYCQISFLKKEKRIRAGCATNSTGNSKYVYKCNKNMCNAPDRFSELVKQMKAVTMQCFRCNDQYQGMPCFTVTNDTITPSNSAHFCPVDSFSSTCEFKLIRTSEMVGGYRGRSQCVQHCRPQTNLMSVSLTCCDDGLNCQRKFDLKASPVDVPFDWRYSNAMLDLNHYYTSRGRNVSVETLYDDVEVLLTQKYLTVEQYVRFHINENYRVYIISTELLIIFVLYTVYIMRGVNIRGRVNLRANLFRFTEHIDEMDTAELQSAVIAKLESRTQVGGGGGAGRAGASMGGGAGGRGSKLAAKLAASRMLSATEINDNLLKVLAVKPRSKLSKTGVVKNNKSAKNTETRPIVLLGNQSKSFAAEKQAQQERIEKKTSKIINK